MKGEKRFLAGLAAIAEAARLADVDVLHPNPIRPYTGLMVDLAKKVADGLL
jgi:pyruvate/2-oxoacid:ferredoxin oxidoreductase alpha subunit